MGKLNSAHEQFRDRHFVFLIGHITQFGGAERQALILAKMLRDQVGANVSFLAWSKKPGLMTDALESAGIPVHIHPLDWKTATGWRYSRVARFARLAGFVRYTKNEVWPDYLLPYVGENSKIAGLIWRKTGARYTWWNQRDEGRAIGGSSFEKRLLRKMPDIVSNSWEGRDFLVSALEVPRDRIRVINNAVDLPPNSVDRNEWRSHLALGEGDKLALMVANLTRYKDHETLLHAFALARSQSANGDRYKLALAGRLDATTRHLKALAFDLGLGASLHFLGPVADMDPLYAASDVVIHSSMKEGCPNAVLEGMAHGKCVVGTDISGLRQALGEDVAKSTLAPPRDSNRLAELIVRYLESDSDRVAAGVKNRRRIEAEFNPDKLLAAVLDGIAQRQRVS
jgi:glycosyltransferase involved in cell wall biosynthesis